MFFMAERRYSTSPIFLTTGTSGTGFVRFGQTDAAEGVGEVFCEMLAP